MSDGFNAKDAAGASVPILCDQVTDGVLGTAQKQLVGIVDATIDGTNKLAIDANGRAKVSAAQATDTLMNGTTQLTPKFAAINASASGVTTVIAAVASKKLRILGFFLITNGAVNVNFQSHTTTTTKTGTLYCAANGGVSSGFGQFGWFETVAGEALDINLSGAVSVGGQIVYVEV